MKSLALVRWALAMSLFMWSQIISAATYNVTMSGAHTANLTFTAGAPGSPSIITAVSGTFNGQTVTGLTNLCGTNTAFNIEGQLGFVTYSGIGVTFGNGSDFVVLNSRGTLNRLPGPINDADVNCSGTYSPVTSSVSIVTSTPAPTITTQYNISISGTHTANLTFTAGAPGSPSIITSVSGTFDGQTVTGLTNLCFASNVINSTGLGFVDWGGISVTYGSGSDYVNLWHDELIDFGPPGPINSATVNCGGNDVVVLDSVTSSAPLLDLTPVPSLSEWVMILMASLMVMFAFVRLRRT